ncbi:hypothetical protein DFH09DRAFT_1106534 [Mycena vulgaris]|nr:hypothetical protein DFH09DRAFT_1106534 [Mycena vulgaris]
MQHCGVHKVVTVPRPVRSQRQIRASTSFVSDGYHLRLPATNFPPLIPATHSRERPAAPSGFTLCCPPLVACVETSATAGSHRRSVRATAAHAKRSPKMITLNLILLLAHWIRSRCIPNVWLAAAGLKKGMHQSYSLPAADVAQGPDTRVAVFCHFVFQVSYLVLCQQKGGTRTAMRSIGLKPSQWVETRRESDTSRGHGFACKTASAEDACSASLPRPGFIRADLYVNG